MRIVRRKPEENESSGPPPAPVFPGAPLTVPVAIPTQPPSAGTTRMSGRPGSPGTALLNGD